MSKATILKALIPAALLSLGGCMASGHYDDYAASYQQDLDQMEQSNSQHETTIMAATDLSVVATEESDHYAQMKQMMENMMGTTDDLSQCDTSMMGSTDMSGMNSSMQQEMDTHQTNMGNATTIDTAQQEETRHQTQMDEMFQSMDSTSDQMSGMMGTDMGC